MKRSAIAFWSITVLVGILAASLTSSRSTAQTGDPAATISALETRVAELEGTVSARGQKINAQRTQIAELKGTEPATVDSEPTDTTGSVSIEWDDPADYLRQLDDERSAVLDSIEIVARERDTAEPEFDEERYMEELEFLMDLYERYKDTTAPAGYEELHAQWVEITRVITNGAIDVYFGDLDPLAAYTGWHEITDAQDEINSSFSPTLDAALEEAGLS